MRSSDAKVRRNGVKMTRIGYKSAFNGVKWRFGGNWEIGGRKAKYFEVNNAPKVRHELGCSLNYAERDLIETVVNGVLCFPIFH